MSRCGVAADLQPPEDPVEVIASRQVVVILQGREPQALAEATGTEEKDLFTDFLHRGMWSVRSIYR